MKTSISRALITAGATGSALLLTAGIASAHVTVNAPQAAQGGYSVLTFQVPTESETASTTKLTVTLPSFKSARTEPLAGWTSTVQKDDKLQATSVTWTADPNVGVAPGQFQRFVLSVGPLPQEKELSLPAVQTYSDGKVVDWNQPMGADGSEPEHPAPSIELAAAGASDDDDHGSAAPAAAPVTHDDATGSDTTARWLGGIGLVLGALGAALGIGAVVRGRRS
ncbi:YcnI family copper-binding membrane protein [Antrihabitans cavernicola]|uniref:YcnI family protein n=1 Tax=Antrihabitans cavernicola TaxID=2495913 RepID=A0A5A7SG39_9NOCA|nr:YcnI family protein [Spelaeibacter cavernicola]KAA0024786.1 YcnI family protein [Spelaeibacter cavernicola]